MSQPTPPPRFTEEDVRCLTSPQSFQLGYKYYQAGSVLEPVCRGNKLQAYCRGSRPQPYRVTVSLEERGVAQVRCTCPYDWGGLCKHAVALLLTWVHNPQAFHQRLPLEEALAQRSREELLALIREMLKRQPDLEHTLDLPLPPDRDTSLDLEPYRRQVAYALRRDHLADIAAELEAITETADEFLEQDSPMNAGAIYHLLLDQVVPCYAELYDDEGYIAEVLERCAAGLDRCFLSGAPEPSLRRAWLEALLEAELKDIEMGGISLAPTAGEAVLNHATAEEWAWIEPRVRSTLNAARGWQRETLVGFLAQRLERTGRVEEANALVLDLGTPQQQAFLLVKSGRLEEAVEIARRHFSDLPGLVMKFADALVTAGAGETALAYVTEQADREDHSYHYLPWLARYFHGRGELSAALQCLRQHFQRHPSQETYRSLRDLAKHLGTWDDLRPSLLGQLEKERNISLLLDIALEEGDIARALALLPRLRSGAAEYYRRVAKAAEADHPRPALELYRSLVEQAIGSRQRRSYQEAARLLKRMRTLYCRLQAEEEWKLYIQSLRTQHQKLRAFQDELNRAGLA